MNIRQFQISEMDQLDIYWADISAVFGLTRLFGPPLKHQDTEVPAQVSEETSNFLQNDVTMAEFVEDFVMDSYNIILREDIVPKFWDHFQAEEVECINGFHKFCQAIEELHSDVKEFSPKLDELERLRERCGTHRTLYGQRTVGSLFSLALKGTLHSQLSRVSVAWQDLVKQFYNQSFCCYHKDTSTSVQSAEDSGDYEMLTGCSGCSETQEFCQCEKLIAKFDKTIIMMSALELQDKLAPVDQVVMEVLQEKINSHVLETCKGSFVCSFLSSLEDWLDRVVMVWVRAAKMTGVSRKRLLDNLYTSYTRARIEQLFNIMIEWPDSQPALEDIRQCLATTDLRAHLTSSLKTVLDTKLLHPGVNTDDILTAYIAAIRSLTVLDPSGVVLQLVCQDVRKYLKTREDTVRCIVQSLLNDSTTELTDELQKTQGLHLDHSFQSPDDWECLDDWESWQPDPVDAPSKNTGRRSSDIISMLVNIYGSKELFVNEYRSLLSNRLLSSSTYDTDREIRHLELLKLRFGEGPLHQCEVMLKDLGDSKRINSALYTVEGGCQDLQAAPFPVTAHILSAQFWPQFKNETLELPKEVNEALEVYTSAFQTLKGNRTLVWKPHLGFVDLDLEIGEKVISVKVSPVLAAIIFKFQEATEWTAQQLAASIKVPVSTLRRRISYWQTQGILAETRPDVFTLVEDGGQRRGGGGGLADISGMADDPEDSVTASTASQREEELGVFWSYIVGMLTNLESLPLERINQTLRIFCMQGPSGLECDMEELRAFLDTKVRQHKLAFSGGQYRLPK